MNEKEQILKRSKRWLWRRFRKFRSFFNRGWGYAIARGLTTLIYGLIGAVALVVVIIILAETGVNITLDWNTIISIFVADVPVGLALYALLERRESNLRKILNASEIVSLPKDFSHLIAIYFDDFEDAEYPDKNYYIVNTKSKRAYYVSDEMYTLIEERIVRQSKQFSSLEALRRYFDAQGIKQEPNYPQGDDLFRDSPLGD